jgi:hypothetical protein
MHMLSICYVNVPFHVHVGEWGIANPIEVHLTYPKIGFYFLFFGG